jgi:hypothetical protein
MSVGNCGCLGQCGLGEDHAGQWEDRVQTDAPGVRGPGLFKASWMPVPFDRVPGQGRRSEHGFDHGQSW